MTPDATPGIAATPAGRRARHLGAGVVIAGIAVIAVARWLGPSAAVPLYDGVVVQEPYRYLSPPPGAAGNPTKFGATIPIVGGSSPPVAAATTESPPQAQLVVPAGAFVVGPAATAILVTIDPVPPPTGATPAGGLIGNVYRVGVTDQGGEALVPAAGATSTILIRAPHGFDQARIARFDGQAWEALQTDFGGQPGIFLANTGVLGDFSLVATQSSGPFGVDPTALSLAVIVGLGAIGAAVYLFLRPAAMARTERNSQPTDPRRRRGGRPKPPGGAS